MHDGEEGKEAHASSSKGGLEPFEDFSSPPRRHPHSHTDHFDRGAYYGATTNSLETSGQLFLNTCQGRLMTLYLYAANVIAGATALAVVVVGIMVGQQHKQQIVGAVSDAFALAIIGFGLAMLGFAILGIIAAKTSNRLLLIAYLFAVLTLLAALGTLMLTQAIVLHSHRAEDMVRHVWEQTVQEHPLEICDLQHDLRCSGFASNCTEGVLGRPDCANCTDPSDASYPRACWSLLQDEVTQNLKPLTYVSVVTLLIVALAFMAACGICRHMQIRGRERRLYEHIRG